MTLVEINGNRLHVEILGEDGAPTLIVHHGAPGLVSHVETKAGFGALADELRVVVFDARGCGVSEGQPPFTNAQWTDDLDGLRAWLGCERIFVAGGSYGGFIAMEYALRYPQHTAALVLRGTTADRAMLDAGIRHALTSERTTIDRVTWERYVSAGVTSNDDLADIWRMLLPMYGYEHRPEEIEARIAATPFRFETQNAALMNLATFDLKDQLGAIACPTLVTVGRHDWIAPPELAAQIAARIPGARLRVFERSGHSPEVDEGPAFVRAVRTFLREVAAQSAAG